MYRHELVDKILSFLIINLHDTYFPDTLNILARYLRNESRRLHTITAPCRHG